MGLGRGLERGADRPRVVGQHAEVAHAHGQAAQEADQDEPVGVVDPALRQRPARGHDLVAGREHGDLEAAAHRQLGEAELGRHADVLRSQAQPGLEDGLAGANVLAAAAAVGADPEARRDQDVVVLARHRLLERHRVGAGGKRRPGEDAERVAGRERRGEGVAGGGAAGPQGEAGGALRHAVGPGEGVAVDRDVVEGRHVARAHDRLGQDAPRRLGELDALGTRDRLDALAQQVEGGADREALAGVGEAVVGAAQGRCSSSRRRRIRSAIAGTSSRPRTGTARSGSGSSEATATTVGSSRAISGVPRSARWTSTLGWGSS